VVVEKLFEGTGAYPAVHTDPVDPSRVSQAAPAQQIGSVIELRAQNSIDGGDIKVEEGDEEDEEDKEDEEAEEVMVPVSSRKPKKKAKSLITEKATTSRKGRSMPFRYLHTRVSGLVAIRFHDPCLSSGPRKRRRSNLRMARNTKSSSKMITVIHRP
jgi:hypothetical protein